MTRLFFFLPFFSFLISCSTTPPIKRNFPHSAQETSYIAPSYLLETSDHIKIPLRFYRPTDHKHPTQPRAIILALHGFGDSRDGWEYLAPPLIKENILIIAPDCRGFGEAPPSYHWSTNKRLIEDTQEEILWIYQHYPKIPIYLLGESMGGAESLLLNIKSSAYIHGTILLSPAIMHLPQPLPFLLSFWNMITPNMILTSNDAPGHSRIATTNIAALRRFYFDPLTQHYTRLNALNGLVSLMDEAYQAAPQAKMPLLVIYGDHDDFIPKTAITKLFQKLPPKTRFDIITNGHHLLSREKNFIAADILSWINNPENFLPSGGDFTAMTWETLY